MPPLRPDTLLAGLPRLVRVTDETRWRGQSAVLTALVVAAFWAFTWLVGEPVRPGPTALAAAAAALPALLIASRGSPRRIRDSLERAVAPPRATVHETAASARDRRMRLAGAVLTGVILLLLFDHFTGGGGVTAGLVAGALGALGAVEWVEARRWEAAERERGTRVYVLMRPDALTPGIGAGEVFERPRPGAEGPATPGPFDLEV